jgi:hypothetical protein
MGTGMKLITLNKMLLYMGLAVLLLAVAKMASGQPEAAGMDLKESDPVALELTENNGLHGPPPVAAPAEVLLSARGLAIKDNENHTFELVVERMGHVDPALIRRLLSSNKSLEEIKEMIREEQGEITHRGAIRLDKRLYLLINIQVLPLERNTTLDAEVALPGFGKALGNEIPVIGHMTVTICPSKGERIGQGTLTLDGDQQPGIYEVLLKTWTDGPMMGK